MHAKSLHTAAVLLQSKNKKLEFLTACVTALTRNKHG